MKKDIITLDVAVTQTGDHFVLPQTKVESIPKNYTIEEFPTNTPETTGYMYAPWFLNDNFPTEVRRKLQRVPMAMAAIDKLVKMMYGNGIVYALESDIAASRQDVQPAFIQEIEDFLQKNRINTAWYLAQCADYRFYMNTFSELIFSDDKKKITGLFHKSAEHCRLTLQSKKTKKIEYLLYSPRFIEGEPRDGEYTAIPLYRWYEQDAFLEKLTGKKIAWHSHFNTPGMLYYARPFWIGLFEDCGWLDVAANVPKIITAMQQNQAVIKYQILISIEYYRLRFQDWNSYTSEQKSQKMDEHIGELNAALIGTDNIFKSIANIYEESQVDGRKIGLIEIKAIDDRTKSDTWVPSSNAADAQIVQGLGLHPSQLGLAPEGGKMGAGSGSDQRESFNTAVQLNTPEQEIILEPLNFISKYNNWGVKFFVSHTTHTTINNKESGLVPDKSTVLI